MTSGSYPVARPGAAPDLEATVSTIADRMEAGDDLEGALVGEQRAFFPA